MVQSFYPNIKSGTEGERRGERGGERREERGRRREVGREEVPRFEDLGPGVGLNLRELVVCVVLVHRHDLLLGGGAEDLDDLHQLVHAAVSGEEGLAEEEFREHAAHRPYICADVSTSFHLPLSLSLTHWYPLNAHSASPLASHHLVSDHTYG